MEGISRTRDPTKQAELPGFDPGPVRPASEGSDRNLWVGRLRGALAENAPDALGIAEDAVRACPGEPEVLLLAALAALAAADPERAFVFLKRYQKRYTPNKAATLLAALALAQQRQFARAWSMLEAERIEAFPAAVGWFVGDGVMLDWLRDRMLEIRLERLRVRSRAATPCPSRPPQPPEPPASRPRQTRAAPVAPAPPKVPDLPRLEARFDVQIRIANPEAIRLLADEVGLGKTVEAGMVLKEYALRGMAERMLILTPAALVGQWRDEMVSKFSLDCATSHDPLLRSDPARFWAQPRLIASPRCRTRMRDAGGRTSGSRRSRANTRPSSTTCRANTRCGSASNGCRPWSSRCRRSGSKCRSGGARRSG